MANADTDIVAVQGYDVVSYHQGDGVPVKGNGHHVATYKGASYLFATEENHKIFTANPEKYAPAYGGFCAFGVSKGKKFVSDPLAYKIVDSKLYLNLDKNVQHVWLKEESQNIADANKNWTKIETIPASEL
jgi:YHS domain-containing protein